MTQTHSLNVFKDLTHDMCRRKGWDRTAVNTVWLLFTEEIGELASAIRQNSKIFKKTGLRKNRGVDIQAEMGDVFSYLFQLAYMLNVDLDAMWLHHQSKAIQRKYSDSSIH
jgi:NTP pyrophosphatase (non-canonical NTP hydrolase)